VHISVVSPETAINGPHLMTGPADAIWRGRFKMSLLLVHRNKTSAYRSRLPLILLPWGYNSPHTRWPQEVGKLMNGCQTLVTEECDSSPCQSPFLHLKRADTLVLVCSTSDMI
jgi:hypothetical protein